MLQQVPQVTQTRVAIIPFDRGRLNAELIMPAHPTGIVIFVQDCGSGGRLSPRNRYIAEALNQAGLATLLFDLLTPAEESVDDATHELRCDMPLLAERLRYATDWVRFDMETHGLPIGYLGAGTGAAAAIVAASRETGDVVKAIVCRSGYPEMAGRDLHNLNSPLLLVAGAEDEEEVLRQNQQAFDRLPTGVEKRLEILPSAFLGDGGALESAGELSASWFQRHLR